CRALIINPDILFLDEPFTGLDIGLKRELMNALKHEVKKSTSLLMITHDLTEAIELTDTIMVLYGEPGRIELEYKIETTIEKRNPTFINTELDKLLRKKEVKQAYGLL
ncbi:MAG: ABC transporter ATP-binding protein, partial [Leptonema sp. (in: Bacteria)]|nr:ABC transporter ATP-binding protein [Leptonema sp. (in: bacteria)]